MQFFHVGRLFGAVAEPGDKILIPTEVIEPSEYSQLLDQVGIVVDYRGACKCENPFFATADALYKFGLLGL